MKTVVNLLKETYRQWSEDKAPQWGATLAYYTVFSLALLLVIVIALAGLFFGQQAVSGEVSPQIQGLVGQDAANAVQRMIQAANKPREGTIATAIGVVTLALGASSVFTQLKQVLNAVWNAPPHKGGGIFSFVGSQLLSFSMALVSGFLLLVSLVLSATISALAGLLDQVLPSLKLIVPTVNFILSFGIMIVLFALMFKVLPDIKIPWSDVWIGAIFTAVLFAIGKEIIGLYLGRASVTSSFGAAGSLAVILIWAYYSAQILFFGAEFARVYAGKYGSRIPRASTPQPEPLAPPVEAAPEKKTGTVIRVAVMTLGLIFGVALGLMRRMRVAH